MSLPESQREQLLSASLDDALSPDEQAMLQRWFQQDPSAAAQRDAMAQTREQLREALRPLRQAKLGPAFADRVVAAAIAQAQQEKLPASHPLLRAAQPNVAPVPQPGGDRRIATSGAAWRLGWRGGAAAIALAASVLLAVFFSRSVPPVAPVAPPELAQHDPVDSPGPVVAEAGDGDRDARIAAGGSGAAEQMPPVAADAPPAVSPSDPSAVAARDAGTPQADAPSPQDVVTAEQTPGRAAVTPPEMKEARPDDQPAAEPAVPLVAVLVVSVELTPQGRQSLALHGALREAGIRIAPEGVASEQVLTHLQQSLVIERPEEDAAAKMYYVEAPAKQLDRFLLRLMADRESFATFGFSIADQPPLLASVHQWRVIDPRQLRHADTSAIARDLVGADGQPLAIDHGPGLVPLPRDSRTAELLGATAPDASESTDITSQILLLVR